MAKHIIKIKETLEVYHTIEVNYDTPEQLEQIIEAIPDYRNTSMYDLYDCVDSIKGIANDYIVHEETDWERESIGYFDDYPMKER